MIIENIQTKRRRTVTVAEFEALKARGDAFAKIYRVVEDAPPELPKEIKKLSGKTKPPESDNDVQATTNGLPDENVRQDQ